MIQFDQAPEFRQAQRYDIRIMDTRTHVYDYEWDSTRSPANRFALRPQALFERCCRR